MAGFTPQPDDALRALADRLVDHYAGRDPARDHAIRDLVSTEAARFREAKVLAFVPILVERAVRDRLDTGPPPIQ